MTVIAYRDGVIAADSRETISTDGGGDRMYQCEKLFRKTIKEGRKKVPVIIATSGESTPGMVFVDWYGTGTPPPHQLIEADADFECLIVRPDGLFVADRYCRLTKVIVDKFYAIGSGTKVALGAMAMGATAKQACEIACKYDPNCAPPIVTMRLPKNECK